MERAALKAKAAALEKSLAIEKEEADWYAEMKGEEAQLQAEEKQRQAAIKAKKEMHAMQTALAESDAKRFAKI